MAAVEPAEVVADSGLVGNSDQGGSRQVTVLSAERWSDVEADLGRTVEPSARRANLLVDGVERHHRPDPAGGRRPNRDPWRDPTLLPNGR